MTSFDKAMFPFASGNANSSERRFDIPEGFGSAAHRFWSKISGFSAQRDQFPEVNGSRQNISTTVQFN